MVVNDGGTRICVHPRASCPLYHCATDSDQIPALLQGGITCMVSLVKIQNDQIRTEGGVVI